MSLVKVIESNLEKEIKRIKQRQAQLKDPIAVKAVQKIIQQVIDQGDQACFKLTQKFDGVKLQKENFPVSDFDGALAHSQCEVELLQALRKAIANISEYALKQVPHSWTYDRENGATLGMRFLPIKRVGLYVPGGRANYPSTVLMTAVFAKVAGVEEVVVTCPPGKNGLPPATVLAACREVGVNEVYPLGGAQAIAAMAYGTETIKPVDKIFGPGNLYVTLAKREVFGTVGIDQLAGPSESVIIADDSVSADWVAADLLIQAEHDPLAASILVTPSKKLAKAVVKRVDQLVEKAPRQKILKQSLKKWGAVFIARDLNQALAISNMFAPEHLQLMVNQPYEHLNKITNAGAIFIGPYTPETVGDYMAGPSHVLPTYGTARFSSPLSVLDFVRATSLVEYSQKAFKEEAPFIQTLTEKENLAAHGQAVQIRLKSNQQAK